MPSAPTSSAQFVDLVRRSGIVPPDKLASMSDLSLPPEPQKAAAAMVAQGFVTKFQALQLLAGRHKGFRIGPYTILDMLGRGGMGAVYLAEHTALHRKVAVKVLVPAKDEDQKLAMVRFQREARAAAALDHPNIVRIFDVARHNNVPYLVMEYVEGETLQSLVDRTGSVPYTTATEYIAQAASGLQHAHEKGFVHRDIKPGNLMLDTTGTVKILDMGLARSVHARDQVTAQLDNGAVVGTADFIAPEQAINNPSVDIRADIYSLGATLFSLIIGKPPFDGNTTQKLLQHQLRSAPSMNSIDATLPRELSDVVAKMLSKKPVERYQTPAEVIAALTPWMAPSARILVGLSRTSLAASDEAIQATLSGIHRDGSSARMSHVDIPGDSSEFSVLESGKETGSLSSSKTTREVNPQRLPVVWHFYRKPALAGLAAMLLVGVGLGSWLIFGRDSKPAAPSDPALATARTGESPKPQGSEPHPPVQTSTSAEPVLYRFDATGQTPFVHRLGLIVDPNDPNKKTNDVRSRNGAGELPAGWRAECWLKDSEVEVFGEAFGGVRCLGIRNLRSPGLAVLFTPSFECPTGLCRLRIEYQTAANEKRFQVKFRPSDQRPAWEVAMPQATGEVWRIEDVIVDLRGAEGGLFELHDTDGDPAAAVRIRSLTVSGLKAASSASEAVLFKLDAADVPEFKTTKEGFDTTAGDDPPVIRGLSYGAYKKETISEWRCAFLDGVRVFSFANVNEARSAQIGVEIEDEKGLKLKLEPGQRVRMRVVYRTSGRARGSICFQTYGAWEWLVGASLPNSNDEWRTVELTAIRGDKPIRGLIDTETTGAEDFIHIRSITITDAGKVP